MSNTALSSNQMNGCLNAVFPLLLPITEWPCRKKNRKIRIFSADFINWILDSFLGESIKVVHRDTTPVRCWIQIGIQVSLVVGCLGVAIFGWWHPNT